MQWADPKKKKKGVWFTIEANQGNISPYARKYCNLHPRAQGFSQL